MRQSPSGKVPWPGTGNWVNLGDVTMTVSLTCYGRRRLAATIRGRFSGPKTSFRLSFAAALVLLFVILGTVSQVGIATSNSDSELTSVTNLQSDSIGRAAAVGHPIASGSPSLTVWNGATTNSFPPATVMIFGSGFHPTSSLTVKWKYGTACKMKTNASGEFNCGKYTTPLIPAGVYLFTAKDSEGSTAEANYSISPDLGAPSPGDGPTGTVVTSQGNGYHADSIVTMTGIPNVACKTKSNSSGSASCSYTVPCSAPVGTYVITATDSEGYKGWSVGFHVSAQLTDCYSVTFKEKGLPAGSEWWANLTNGQTYNSTTSTLTFTELNGTYHYTLASVDSGIKTKVGKFSVDGVAVTKSVTFEAESPDSQASSTWTPTAAARWTPERPVY